MSQTSARIIDGRAKAKELRRTVAHQIYAHFAGARLPSLAILQVGNDDASDVYVKNKFLAARESGITVHQYALPASATEPNWLVSLTS